MRYKELIVEMLDCITNEKILRLIYGFVSAGYKEDRAMKGGAA